MLRQKHFDFIDTYKDEAFTAIKAVMKQVILFLSKGDLVIILMFERTYYPY
jgi:hypothetical protein